MSTRTFGAQRRPSRRSSLIISSLLMSTSTAVAFSQQTPTRTSELVAREYGEMARPVDWSKRVLETGDGGTTRNDRYLDDRLPAVSEVFELILSMETDVQATDAVARSRTTDHPHPTPSLIPVSSTYSASELYLGPGTPRCSCIFKLSHLHHIWIIAETPFEDGTFKLLLTFDDSYPNKPPSVKFLSRMFHPNVYANGELCLDILQNRWSPTYDVAAILTSIQSLLHDPNPNSPANAEAAQLYRENMKEYVRRVKATVEESWLDPDEKVDLEDKDSVMADGQ